MRSGCLLLVGSLVMVVGLAGAGLWVGSRMVREPDVVAAQGTAEDGARGQQKIFDLLRAEPRGSRGRPREVVLTEAELNRFLTKNLVEVARTPVTVRAVRLAGDGIVEFKGLLALR